MTVLLSRFLDLGVFGILVCLKDNLLLVVADRSSFVQSKVRRLVMTLGRMESLPFCCIFGFAI